jgi:tRNA A37 threonylcarbamoyladenosine biosynthesis protein TsaE
MSYIYFSEDEFGDFITTYTIPMNRYMLHMGQIGTHVFVYTRISECAQQNMLKYLTLQFIEWCKNIKQANAKSHLNIQNNVVN